MLPFPSLSNAQPMKIKVPTVPRPASLKHKTTPRKMQSRPTRAVTRPSVVERLSLLSSIARYLAYRVALIAVSLFPRLEISIRDEHRTPWSTPVRPLANVAGKPQTRRIALLPTRTSVFFLRT